MVHITFFDNSGHMEAKSVSLFFILLFRYCEGLQKCLGLYSDNGQYSLDEIEQLDALYKSLRQQYKWSSAAKVMVCAFIFLLSFIFFDVVVFSIKTTIRLLFSHIICI